MQYSIGLNSERGYVAMAGYRHRMLFWLGTLGWRAIERTWQLDPLLRPWASPSSPCRGSARFWVRSLTRPPPT